MLSWTHFAALFDGRWKHWEWTVSLPASKLSDETLPAPLSLKPMPVPVPVPAEAPVAAVDPPPSTVPQAQSSAAETLPFTPPATPELVPPKEGSA
jgi:hypothetical protein